MKQVNENKEKSVKNAKDFNINDWLKNNYCADTFKEIQERPRELIKLNHGYNEPYVSDGIIEYIPITKAELLKYAFQIDMCKCLAYSEKWTQDHYNEAPIRAIEFSYYKEDFYFVDLNDYYINDDVRKLSANSAHIFGLITTITNHYQV